MKIFRYLIPSEASPSPPWLAEKQCAECWRLSIREASTDPWLENPWKFPWKMMGNPWKFPFLMVYLRVKYG